MKGLIDCRTGAVDWPAQMMPGLPPFMLRLVNKPLLEFYIDLCVLLHVDELRIVQHDPAPEVEEYFQDGSRWGIALSYATARPDESLENVFLQNQAFLDDSELVLFRGLNFIEYDKQNTAWTRPGNADGLVVKDLGEVVFAWLSGAGRLHHAAVQPPDNCEFPVRPLHSVKTYFDLNMTILQEDFERYYLPGYSNEDGVCLGQNVEIARSCAIDKPVAIADNVKLKAITSIGPAVIIEPYVLVDKATTIANSIVCSSTYVGSDLEIRNKIIYRNFLIDPLAENHTAIVDRFLLTEIGRSDINSRLILVCHQFLALAMIVVQTIPYLLLRWLVKPGRRTKAVYCDKELTAVELSFPDCDNRGLAGRLWHLFSLDRYPLLFQVLRGRLFLAGNRPWEATPEAATNVRMLAVYHPAVFTYAEAVNPDSPGTQEENLHEFYYSRNPGLGTDFWIIVKNLFNRLFSCLHKPLTKESC